MKAQEEERISESERSRMSGGSISGPPTLNTHHQTVSITKAANGFILHIGCKIFIAKTWVEAANELGKYWTDLVMEEKKYLTI